VDNDASPEPGNAALPKLTLKLRGLRGASTPTEGAEPGEPEAGVEGSEEDLEEDAEEESAGKKKAPAKKAPARKGPAKKRRKGDDDDDSFLPSGPSKKKPRAR